MNKFVVIVAVLSLVLLTSMIVAPSVLAAPPINRPFDFCEATFQGNSPRTVDYSWGYDTASGEILQNTMDTLIVLNTEHTDSFLPSLATSWASAPLGPNGTGIDSGIPIDGLNFESAEQTGPNATYFYRYDFKIRLGITFQPPYNYSLTPADIAYSFQRSMVHDAYGGPEWMLQEPLLDQAAGDNITLGGLADLTNQAQVNELGRLIESSVQYNSTDVWFNLMYPGAYSPFLQILCQTWSSVESKQWIINQVIAEAGRPDWDGDWSKVHPGWAMDHTDWVLYHNPSVSPLDSPTPMEYGSGPFILTALDYTDNYWLAIRNAGYFRAWPANFPVLAGVAPAGYVDTIEVTWNFNWTTRKNMFLSGDCDFVAVPSSSYYNELYKSPTPPYDPPNYPLNGIRCTHPLPELAVDGFFFTFDITPSTVSGTILPEGTFDPSGIPSDFFGNSTWGIYVRKAFAQAFDYATYISTVFLGEASHPATAIIPGLADYDPTVAGWTYNLAAANASFNLVPGLNTTGFTITLAYSPGNIVQQQAVELLQSAIQGLNPLYHVTVISVDWNPYIHAAEDASIPCFIVGWLADFPDPHDFAWSFYHTGGDLAVWQAYSNATMDQLIDQGIATPEGPARAAIYTQIEKLAMADCPSFMLAQPVGRHFERDWVAGWYYNMMYPSEYFYNLWKWYYVPESLDSTQSQPHGYNLPADVNYDGKVDMKDISAVAKAFGTSYGPPISSRWAFRGDVNNDRKIDMKDIAYVAKLFGKNSRAWIYNGSLPAQFPLYVSPGVEGWVYPVPGVGLTFANVTVAGYVTAYNSSTVTVPPLDNPVGPYYHINVMAVFSGNITVSLAFDGSGMNDTQKSNLRMMQYSPDQGWVNITTSVDTTRNIIYGETTHFSLIGIH